MTIERKLNPVSEGVELWWRGGDGNADDERRLIGAEQPLAYVRGADEEVAICWARGRTIGNAEMRSPRLLNHLAATRGENVCLPCDFVYAGKFRHGADRWWCRTHQNHWGIKADIAALRASGEFRCAGFAQPMNYVVGPFTVDLDAHAEVGVWCSLPAALSSQEIKPRPPQIHVHVRDVPSAEKRIDRDFPAISAIYSSGYGFLAADQTNRVDITPPAAFEFVCALESHKAMECIDCSHCGQPHLDLGDFGKTPHRKHFCANCGRDSTWSQGPIISTPLKPLHDRSATQLTCLMADRRVNLDDYQGFNYRVWASTPAIVWTAARPQEYGIHVHIHDGTKRIIDDTFGEVILDGRALVREELLQTMIERAIV